MALSAEDATATSQALTRLLTNNATNISDTTGALNSFSGAISAENSSEI